MICEDIKVETQCQFCFFKVRLQNKKVADSKNTGGEEYLLGCTVTPNFILTTTIDSTCKDFKVKKVHVKHTPEQ